MVHWRPAGGLLSHIFAPQGPAGGPRGSHLRLSVPPVQVSHWSGRL
jgi:hypothetical protein